MIYDVRSIYQKSRLEFLTPVTEPSSHRIQNYSELVHFLSASLFFLGEHEWKLISCESDHALCSGCLSGRAGENTIQNESSAACAAANRRDTMGCRVVTFCMTSAWLKVAGCFLCAPRVLCAVAAAAALYYGECRRSHSTAAHSHWFSHGLMAD